MSSEQFESYELEFDNIARSIKRKINSQLPNFTGEQRKACIRQATKEIERAEDLLQEMEMESRSAPPAYRNKMNSRLRGYQADVDGFTRDLSSAGSSAGGGGQNARDQLMGGGDSYDGQRYDQRSRLLDNDQTLDRTSGRITNAQRIGEESEAIGAGVLSELDSQQANSANSDHVWEHRGRSDRGAEPTAHRRGHGHHVNQAYSGAKPSSRADRLPASGRSRAVPVDDDAGSLRHGSWRDNDAWSRGDASILQRARASSMTPRQMQLQRDRGLSDEIEANSREIAEREEHMRHIESQMQDINEMFRDLHSLVIEQGDTLNTIEANMDHVTVTVAKGVHEVVTANAYHKKRSFGWW